MTETGWRAMTELPFRTDYRFTDEMAASPKNDPDVVIRLAKREDKTMPRCSFGHDSDVVRVYQVMEKEPGQPPSGPPRVLDKGQTCPDHREMIITAKSDRQQDKRLAAAQRFRETSAPNEHTAAIEKSFELDKPAGEPLSHETYINGSVRDRQPPPRPRDDRDNIERGFGRDLLVHS